jgi:hypothetical protein
MEWKSTLSIFCVHLRNLKELEYLNIHHVLNVVFYWLGDICLYKNACVIISQDFHLQLDMLVNMFYCMKVCFMQEAAHVVSLVRSPQNSRPV